ncbi:MAG: WecB/TagA/CpsF family glycosyltransferase [Frankia sp.]
MEDRATATPAPVHNTASQPAELGGEAPQATLGRWLPAAAQLPVVLCARVPITSCSRAEAAQHVVELATAFRAELVVTGTPGRRRPGLDIHQCTAHTIAEADGDPALLELLRRASINFPDGKAVVWANRLVHRGRRLSSERVYGPDLFADVVALGQDAGLRHFLLGSTPDVLARLETNLVARYPGAVIAGAESPPFRKLSESEQRDQESRIRESGAQIVWVGLGTPKQDWEAARLADALPLLSVAVGAAFDFIAGTKSQAPRWMRDNGLEWFYRLASEPRRLWRRYLFGNSHFILAVLRHHRARAEGAEPAAPDVPSPRREMTP